MKKYRVLFVCLGNICRSPTAEAALRQAVTQHGMSDRVEIDSAGTGAWHVGKPPDERMAQAGAVRGLRLTGAARRVEIEDFFDYDLILAMDSSNRADLLSLAPDVESSKKVRMFREFEANADAIDVPDPYYGHGDGFLQVVDMALAGAQGLVEFILEQQGVVR